MLPLWQHILFAAMSCENTLVMPNAAGTRSAFAQTRCWPRFRINLPICVVVPDEVTPVTFNARAAQISERGMSVSVETELKIGDKIFLQFMPAQGVELQGALIRSRSGYNYGVEFVSDNPKE